MSIDIDHYRRFARLLGAFMLATVLLLATGCAEPCGPGTEAVDGRCVPSAAGCGAGTMLEDGVCVPSDDRCADGLLLYARVCAAGPGTCGSGSAVDEEIQHCSTDADILCGAGTRLGFDDVCVADACGPMTEADSNGRCVLAPTACGDGAVLDPRSGLCVQSDVVCPGGTVRDVEANACRVGPAICDDGTRFIDELGVCVPESCRPGDVIVDDVCARPAEELADAADVVSSENDDPDHGGVANALGLPDIGAPPTVFGGTITEAVDLDDDGREDQDVDAFALQAEAGTWVELTVQTLGIPSASFVVRGPQGYRRETSNGLAMTKARRLILPYDGEYRIDVMPTAWSDAVGRDDVPDPEVGPFGAANWDYVGTVRQIDAPAPRSVTLLENELYLDGLAGRIDDAYLKLGAYDAPLLTFDGAGSSLEILVWGENDVEPTAYRSGSWARDINLRSDGPIDRVIVDWIDGRPEERELEDRLRGVVEMGRFDTTETHVSEEILSATRVFELDVPAYTVVDMNAIDAYRLDAQLIIGDKTIDAAKHFERNGTFTAFSGASDEVWYLVTRDGPWSSTSRWKLEAQKATPTDLGTLQPGDVVEETGTIDCVPGKKHFRFQTSQPANFYASATASTTRELTLLATAAGMEPIVADERDNGATGYEVEAGTPWIVSIDCYAFSGEPFTTTVTVDDSLRTDIGSVRTQTPRWHDAPGLGEGQSVDIDFEVPPNRVIELGYERMGIGSFDLELLDSDGQILEARERADAAYDSTDPRPAISFVTRDGGRFTLRAIADEASDLRAFVRARPFEPVSALAGGQSFGISTTPSHRDVVRVWELDLTEDMVLRQLAPPDNTVGTMDVINAATGEVVASVSPTYADTVTLPLTAGRWLVEMETIDTRGVEVDFETFSADVMREPLESPRRAFEPVHRRIRVAHCTTVDDVALTLQAPPSSSFPWVTLTAPDGTSVDIHRGEETGQNAFYLGYRVPNVSPTESLAAFDGIGGTGDWYLELYDDDNDGAALDAMALEVTCTP